MTLKDQWKKIKDNWLIVGILAVLLAVMLFSSSITESSQTYNYKSAGAMYDMAESSSDGDYAYRGVMPGSSGFAPEVEERKIMKSSSLTTEVERGKFKESESNLKAILASSGSFLLNEDVRKLGEEKESYFSGSYRIKVDTQKYDYIISQLKTIGEVQYFSESATDITGTYTDLNIELAAEKERLARYVSMYSEATKVDDKINLNDRIFDQEKRVKYLEDRIKNIDNKVDYSTVSLTINEEQPAFIGVELAKLSDLVKTLVGSFNGLLFFVFGVLPWAVGAGLIWLVYRLFKKKR